MGIEPTQSAWEAEVLPLNYSRSCNKYYNIKTTECQEHSRDKIEF